jgi:hypothetical protein
VSHEGWPTSPGLRTFAAGATKTINVEGSPKNAGSFDFELDVADEEGSQLLYPDQGALTWSETSLSSADISGASRRQRPVGELDEALDAHELPS